MRLKFLLALFLLLNIPASLYAHPDINQHIHQLNRKIREQGPSAALLTSRGQLRYEHKQYQAAEKDYQQALRLDTRFWKARYELAKLFFERGEIQSALKEIELASDSCESKTECSASFEYLKAGIYSKLDQKDEALQALGALINSGSQVDPSIYIWQADILEESGQSELALNTILKGLSASPDVPSLLDRAVLIQEKLGKTDQAIDLLESSLAKTARKDLVYLRQAEILFRSNRKSDAKLTAGKALMELEKLPEAAQMRPSVRTTSEKIKYILTN